jgi:hypothetical protein
MAVSVYDQPDIINLKAVIAYGFGQVIETVLSELVCNMSRVDNYMRPFAPKHIDKQTGITVITISLPDIGVKTIGQLHRFISSQRPIDHVISLITP